MNNFKDDNSNLKEWMANIDHKMLFLLITFLFMFSYLIYLFNKKSYNFQ